MRAFKSGFFRDLLTVNTLGEIESCGGLLLVVTGRRDAWSGTADALAFRDHHHGELAFAELDVGHRMGTSEGLAAVDRIAQYVLDWLLNE